MPKHEYYVTWADIAGTEHGNGHCNWRELLDEMDRQVADSASVGSDPKSRLISQLVLILDCFQKSVFWTTEKQDADK